MMRKLSPYRKPPPGTMVNQTHPLAQGLVGAWLMNEGAGTYLYDSSGQKRHGVGTTPTWTSDGYGQPVCTMNNGPYAVLDAGIMRSLAGATSVTLICKFKQLATGYTGYAWAGAIDGTTHGLALYLASNKFVIKVRPASGDTTRDLTSTPAFTSTSVYYTVAAVVNVADDTIQIYVNGVLQAATGTTTWTATAFSGEEGTRSVIGATVTLSNPIKFDFAHAYLYRRALTVEEIMQHYLDPYAMYATSQQMPRLYTIPVR